MKFRCYLVTMLLATGCSFSAGGGETYGEDKVEEKLSEDVRPAVERVRKLCAGNADSKTFIYFTDPHLLGIKSDFSDEIKNGVVSALSAAKEVYDVLKPAFCLCGGDWLNAWDTQAVAKEKILYADKQMKAMFSNYHKMLGNHDTNYQGMVSETDSSWGDFPREFIDREYFSESGSAYHSFYAADTRFYVLDSGSDWHKDMDDYRWEQLLWLAGELQEDKSEHIMLCTHMFHTEGSTLPMSDLLIEICDAFNSRQSIDLQGRSFSFASAKGSIHAVFAGHTHVDDLVYLGKSRNIPVIETCNLCYTSEYTSFDICVIDYPGGKLHLVRCGAGESREVKIAEAK